MLTTAGNLSLQLLQPNYHFDSSTMQIRLSLSLNDDDRNNLSFLLNNQKEFDELLKTYTNVGTLPKGVSSSSLAKISILTIFLTAEASGNQFSASIANPNSELEFVLRYLRQFDVLQKLIELRNQFFKATGQQDWPALKPTFLLIGSYRNYSNFTESFAVADNKEDAIKEVLSQLRREVTRAVQTNEPPIFSYVKLRLAYGLIDAIFLENKAPQEALESIKLQDFFVRINNDLGSQLGLELNFTKSVNIYDRNYSLSFIDTKTKKSKSISDLSAGEKSLIHLIFSLQGYDIHNGLLLIDEPEIHLHPKIQEAYARALSSGSKARDLQTIVITHSAHFVQVENLKGIRRFYRNNGSTKVASPGAVTFNNTVLKLLDYTKASRAFFSEKVLLVEGETDEMFLRFLVDKIRNCHAETFPWIEKFDKIDVIHIGGKANIDPWRSLLNEFEVKSGFLADCDYLGLVTELKMEELRIEYLRASKKAESEISKLGSRDASKLIQSIQDVTTTKSEESIEKLSELADSLVRRQIRYKKVVENLKGSHPCTYKRMIGDISKAYKSGTYILSQGDLEDYLGIESKGLDALYKFCTSDLDKWFADTNFQEQRSELIGILEAFSQY